MAKEFDNTNSGALFKNEKEGNPKRPDYRGSLNVNGDEYWLSAWLQEAKHGKHAGKLFMSLKVEPKQARDIKGAVAHKEPEPKAGGFNDEFPGFDK